MGQGRGLTDQMRSPFKPDSGLSGDVRILPKLCHPDRKGSSQLDDLWSGGTSAVEVNSILSQSSQNPA